MGLSNRAKGNSREQGQKNHYTSKRTAKQHLELDEIGFIDKKKTTVKYEARTSSSNKSSSPTFQVRSISKGQVFDEREDCWSPSPYAAFKLFVSARFAAALWSTISDCDETFNYWEPIHFLLYGKGFQTWEYSPEFALRSYTYLLLHALPAKIYVHIFQPNPVLVFFLIRCFLGFLSACSEFFLYRAVRKYFGGNISRIALLTSLFAPGMFVSTSALLPSSFSSYMTALAVGSWLDKSYRVSIFAVAVSALLSWPFAALTGAFIAVDLLIVKGKKLLFVTWSTISFVVVMLPMIYVDSSYYKRLVVAPWNIVKYNVLSTKGPNLYGTEPWTFYVINGFLNFNITFVMMLTSPLLLSLSWKINCSLWEKFLILGTTFVWLGVFILQPHKEERFLYPVYPLIPICGAIGLDSLQKCLHGGYNSLIHSIWTLTKRCRNWFRRRDIKTWLNAIGFILIFTSSLIGCSRIAAIHFGYRAPFDVFFNLQREGTFEKFEADAGVGNFTVCFGKEWYRFPSSFFLPNTKWNTRFIKSDFTGQLPNLFPAFDPEGTSRWPNHMNDLNVEEPTRYIPVNDCDFLVDSINEERITSNQPNYAANDGEWEVISEQELINTDKSHPFFRAFYVPFLSPQYTKYNPYVILQRRNAFQTKIRKLRPDSSKIPKMSARAD